MRELGLAVTIDAIGNIVGVRGGREEVPPVMFGSHVDTVATGGRYDGLYGVLAGLEACEAANDASAARAGHWRSSPSPTRKARASGPTRAVLQSSDDVSSDLQKRVARGLAEK